MPSSCDQLADAIYLLAALVYWFMLKLTGTFSACLNFNIAFRQLQRIAKDYCSTNAWCNSVFFFATIWSYVTNRLRKALWKLHQQFYETSIFLVQDSNFQQITVRSRKVGPPQHKLKINFVVISCSPLVISSVERHTYSQDVSSFVYWFWKQVFDTALFMVLVQKCSPFCFWR